MQTLIVLGVVGFFAQLVDGALGMAYGTTSTTLALAVGLSPAVASATVHALAGEHRLSARPRKSGDLLDIPRCAAGGRDHRSADRGVARPPSLAASPRSLRRRHDRRHERQHDHGRGRRERAGPVRALVYVVLGAVWVTAIALVLRAHRRNGVPLTSQHWVGQPASSEAAG